MDEPAPSWERWPIADLGEEHRRLRLIEDAYDSFTVRQLERLGVGAGWRCLEVGAGAGSIAAWLARRAGAANVVATELRPEHLAAVADLGVRVVRHDVVADPPPGDGFDLIHARAVLEHLPARDAVVERLASWLAPGGWLLVEVSSVAPAMAASPVLQRVGEALMELLASTVGTDFTWARRLPLPLERAGLTDVSAELASPPVRGGSPLATVLGATLRGLGPALAAAGRVEEGDVQEVLRLYADPSFVDWSTGAVAASGRRAAVS